MNEWLKRILEQIQAVWKRINVTQRILIFSIAGVVIIAVILLFVFSASPTRPAIFQTAIADEAQLFRIGQRLDQENVPYSIQEGMIFVNDDKTAMRMRSLLVREDLVPKNIDPWAIFDVERWTSTQFKDDINLQRAIEEKLRQHILAIDDIDSANVSLVVSKPTTFREDEEPTKVSVAITAKPGSDILQNHKKVEGIEKLISYGVGGLTRENIAIIDKMTGTQINDFDDPMLQKINEIDIVKKQLALKKEIEVKLRKDIYAGLSKLYTPDRVEVLNIDMDLDIFKRTTDAEEYTPITLIPDNPRTPYDETKVVEYITQKKLIEMQEFEGTGFTPQGPPGSEGQTPPAYKDLSNLVGRYKKNLENIVNVVNKKIIKQEDRPWNIKRLSISVAVDGKWEKEYDPNSSTDVMIDEQGRIQRKYIPVGDEELRRAQSLVEGAVGYNPVRSDQVKVIHYQFDRTAEFEAENDRYRSQKQLQVIIMWIIIGIGMVIVAIIAFRLLSRYFERRRRLKEEELARQHQAMREAALRSAEEKGVDVELSVEERARLEMQENAINMAREHPEDVAQLIRTWLLEE
ncbi:MAG: flagellar M-ring protein FliF [Spirochaetales bacterium]|nr:flagellar M-ring protein FliF [Spirochaetales bacterium]